MAREENDFHGAMDGRADLREVLLPDNEEVNQRLMRSSESEKVQCVFNEIKELTLLSVPVALSTLARLVIINTDTAFVGHLGAGSVMLSASSFATTWNGFLSNIVFAPGYALNSLCSQAIGAGNLKLAGVWLQLAVIFTSILCIPVLVGYLLTDPLVNFIVDEEGRKDDIPKFSQDFNNVSMLILWPMVMYMIIRQYFQAMQVVFPAMIISGLTVGFNYAMNMVFVPEDGPVGWGLKGSPFATFLSMCFQLGSFMLYTMVIRGYHKPYWGGWSWDCMEKSRLSRFFKMVTPMAVGIVLENSGLQLISFSTGHIGKNNIAAHAVLSSLWGMLWAFYWGVGLALQVRVGSKLGEGSIQGAKLVAKISVFLVIIICTITGVAAFAGRTWIAKLFTNDKNVIPIVEDSMYALVLDYFFACMALCGVNLLEAMAQNKILAFTLSVGMWGVQVPCSLLFAYSVPAFKDNQVAGIWLGQVCGELFKMIIVWVYIYRLDWNQMCLEAKERSEVTSHNREDDELEHILEDEDVHFAEETAAISTGRAHHDTHAAEALASSLTANAPSPFIGSRSPKFLRQAN